jgi:uncharacterized protein (TIGR00661 family)
VYLPSWCEPNLQQLFSSFKEFQFEIFCRQTEQAHRSGNILFLPVDQMRFNQSLICCSGIITGGGFETPAEALHLGKKIMAVPIRGQYEQLCNAAALKQMGVVCLNGFEKDFAATFEKWINNPVIPIEDYRHSMQESLDYLFSIHEQVKTTGHLIKEFVTETI